MPSFSADLGVHGVAPDILDSGDSEGLVGSEQSNPSSAQRPRSASSSLTVSGSMRRCMARPVRRARTSTASSRRVGDRLCVHGRRPAVELSGAEPACLGIPLPDHLGHLGVTGRPQPELVLEEGPGSRGPVAGGGDVLPYGGELTERSIVHGHLGQQHGQGRVLPRVQQGQQQPLLVPEVGVHGSRGSSGGLGHRIHGHRVDALLGEEIGGRGQQPGPGLGLALLLGLRHVPPLGRSGCHVRHAEARRPTYLYWISYASGGAGIAHRTVRLPGIEWRARR